MSTSNDNHANEVECLLSKAKEMLGDDAPQPTSLMTAYIELMEAQCNLMRKFMGRAN